MAWYACGMEVEDMVQQFKRCHAELCGLDQFLRGPVREAITPALRIPKEPERTVAGMYVRTVAWTYTLSRLGHPGDMQAQCAACRALFELAVDVALLGKMCDAADRMSAWEASYKLFSAERALAGPAPDPGRVPIYREYVRAHGPSIKTLRDKYWPKMKGKHPRHVRWTGETLRDDVLMVDQAGDGGLLAFHENRYPEVCMGVHGTGLGLVRTADEAAIPVIGLLAIEESCRFAIRIAKDALAACGKAEPGLVAQLDAVLPVVRRQFWVEQLADNVRIAKQFEEFGAND